MKSKRGLQFINIGYIVVPVLGMLLCIMAMYIRNNQSMFPIMLPVELVEEFSYDGEEWFPIEGHDINGKEEQVIFRGELEDEVENAGRVYFFRDHIGVSVYRNNELLYLDVQTEIRSLGIDLMDSMCGRTWDYFVLPDISQGDVLEIYCISNHEHGSKDIYRHFVDSLTYTADTDMLIRNELNSERKLSGVASCLLLVLATMVLGAAVLAGIMRQKLSGTLCLWGLITLSMGGFVYFDSVSELDGLLALRTYGQCLCFIGYVYFTRLLLRTGTGDKSQKTVYILNAAELTLDVVIMFCVFADKVLIYDTLYIWSIFQFVFCILSIWLCIVKIRQKGGTDYLMPVGILVIQIALLMDMSGFFGTMYSSGNCTKICFLIVAFVALVRILRSIILDYNASVKARELEEQLTQKRIALAMSQIRTHFVFNVLTVISSFCKSDADKADEALICFSRYLRRNISIMEKDEPVYFSKELEHLEDYIKLEQMRFGDDIEFVKDIQEADFILPPLVVQPIVENAIKHGFVEHGKRGTVTLCTYKDDAYNYIVITDDGRGFDMQKDIPEESVGIKNVRFRLERMVGGTLEIQSEIEKGTKVTVKIPIGG